MLYKQEDPLIPLKPILENIIENLRFLETGIEMIRELSKSISPYLLDYANEVQKYLSVKTINIHLNVKIFGLVNFYNSERVKLAQIKDLPQFDFTGLKEEPALERKMLFKEWYHDYLDFEDERLEDHSVAWIKECFEEFKNKKQSEVIKIQFHETEFAKVYRDYLYRDT